MRRISPLLVVAALSVTAFPSSASAQYVAECHSSGEVSAGVPLPNASPVSGLYTFGTGPRCRIFNLLTNVCADGCRASARVNATPAGVITGSVAATTLTQTQRDHCGPTVTAGVGSGCTATVVFSGHGLDVVCSMDGFVSLLATVSCTVEKLRF